jgi:hypothetical protein
MRSGTSLLGHLLQKHPSGRRAHEALAFDNDESRFVADTFAALRRAIRPDVGFGDPFRRIEVTDGLLLAAGLDGAAPRERFREALRAEIVRLAPPGAPPSMLGLKRTSMNYELDVLAALFPDVRPVFTVRDPRDVYLSHARRMGDAYGPGHSLLILSYILGNHWMLARLAREGGRHLLVRYEDLVADPAAQVQAILDFAGLDPAGYDFASLDSPSIPSNSSFNEKAGTDFVPDQGITRASIGRHRGAVDESTAQLVDLLCAPILEEHGYAPAFGDATWREEYAGPMRMLRDTCEATGVSFDPMARRLAELGVTLP